MARTFTTASDAGIQMSIGNCSQTGAFTMGLLCRKTSDGAIYDMFCNHTTVPVAGPCLSVSAANVLVASILGTNSTSSVGFTVADSWCFIAVTKASGTATPRLHKMVLSTGVWTHGNGGSSLGNAGSQAGGTVRFAEWADNTGEYGSFEGHIAYGVQWASEKSDSELEALPIRSLFGMAGTSPVGMWVLDQDSISQSVVDWTGGGANQSAITATTVSTASVPDITYFDNPTPVVREPRSALELPYSLAAGAIENVGNVRDNFQAIEDWAAGTLDDDNLSLGYYETWKTVYSIGGNIGVGAGSLGPTSGSDATEHLMLNKRSLIDATPAQSDPVASNHDVHSYPENLFIFNPSDYAIPGKTATFRLRGTAATASTASGGTIGLALYEIENGVSPVAGTIGYEAGPAVPGSSVAMTSSVGVAVGSATDSLCTGVSSTFTLPVSPQNLGLYSIGITHTHSPAGNSKVIILGQLEVSWV